MAPKDLVNQLIKTVVKPAFKIAGFRTDGNTFIKEENGFVKIFNVQHSQFNSSLSAAFYLNAGLYFPLTYGWRYNWPLPSRVKESDCQFRFRTDNLTGRHRSYDVDEGTDGKQIEQVVKSELDAVIHWFTSIKELRDCISAQKQVHSPSQTCTYDVALTYAELGNSAEADEIFKVFMIQRISNPVERERMLAEARKRGISF